MRFSNLLPSSATKTIWFLAVGFQRGVGNEQHVVENRGDNLHVGKHPRLQSPVRVVHGDANLHRARTGLDLVADEHDLAVKLLVGKRQRRERRILTQLHRRDVALLDFGNRPKLRRVADRVDGLALVHQLARRGGCAR